MATSFGRDDQGVPALPVADQLGERRERGSALAGAERRDQKGGVALVQQRCGALLVGTQDAGEEGAFICRRRLRLGVVGADALLRLQRQTCGPVRQGQHLAPQDRLRLLGARLVDLADDLVMRRHADRHERERRVGFDPGYRLAQEVGGGGLHRILAKRAVP